MSRFLNTFGKREKAIREERLYTQEDLVSLLKVRLGMDVSQGYLSKLETAPAGKWPGSEIVAGVARVLRTSTDYLLLLTDDPRPIGERVVDLGTLDTGPMLRVG